MPPLPRPDGIFCLEGEWDGRLTDRTSVEPGLRMLENVGVCGGVIHRDVATRDEFQYYVRKWLRSQYARYSLGYFAFHGKPRAIELGRDDVTLEEIAETLGGGAHDRTLYFGSCRTLAASDEDLQQLCKVTGLRAVAGYTRKVSWVTSAAFDLVLLPALLSSVYVLPVFNRLYKEHPGFVEGLGFRMATADGATPRSLAV